MLLGLKELKMNIIKFSATDIDAKHVYCFFRDTSENKKNTGIEKIFDTEAFLEKEPQLKAMLEGDICSIYLEGNYTEKKSIDGSFTSLTEEEVIYVNSIVKKACIDLEYDVLLVSNIDTQIDNFIKEFFDESQPTIEKETTVVSKEDEKDFLAAFFKELEETQDNEKIQTDNN